jgi:hypothetical protein
MGVRPKVPKRGRHSKHRESRRRPHKWLVRAFVSALVPALANGLVTLPSETSHVAGPPVHVPTPSPTTRPGSRLSPHHRNNVQRDGQGLPATDPVILLSEDPLDPAVEWTYFERLNLGGQLARLTFEIDGNQIAWLNAHFFALGGYAPLVHTRLVFANDGTAGIEIGNIEVESSCTTPADGTLIDVSGLSSAPSPTSNTDISLGYELSQRSEDIQASSARAETPGSWTAGYFDSHSPPIGPRSSQAFDIWVLPSQAACSFWFHIVVLDGPVKFPLTIGDDGQPFRISAATLHGPAMNPAVSGVSTTRYRVVYLGGTASPLPNGALYREPLRPPSRTADTEDA